MMANGIAARIEMVEPLESRTTQLRAMAAIRLVSSERSGATRNPAGAGRTQNHFQCRERESGGQLNERAVRVIVLYAVLCTFGQFEPCVRGSERKVQTDRVER